MPRYEEKFPKAHALNQPNNVKGENIIAHNKVLSFLQIQEVYHLPPSIATPCILFLTNLAFRKQV